MSTINISDKKPYVIAGPCSAETQEQLMLLAAQFAKSGMVDCMRAGVWKPRTRPGHFEGVGDQALEWLLSVKEEYNIPYCTEVADSRQLEQALLHKADMVWIGARTTASPFAVQQLADALNGISIPVLIKNPTNPDLELWIGAVERIGKSVEKIGLIHRGFTVYGAKGFRNPPMYDLAIEMKRRYNNLPYLMDPSHIGGTRKLIKPLLKHAIDLDYDGMMVEVHESPDNALSDASQQITPEAFFEMLKSLVWKDNTAITEQQLVQLSIFRKQIDAIDERLLSLLNERMIIAQQIGAYKNSEHITILQTERLNQVRKNILEIGQKLGLSSDFLKQYINAIHLESINHQQQDFL